jgi:5-hydroxyisourate hydrolase
MSKITTHILDTARGCPAEGVRVILYRQAGGAEEEIVRGETNKDGRIGDWKEVERTAGTVGGGGPVSAGSGIYKIRFETKAYFDKQSARTFYPFVEIHFELASDGHYHIPLLISPFGYTTYRGS